MPLTLFGQIGGQLGYQALNYTSNPRSAALAGSAISLADGDISQFFENPGVLDSVSSGNAFFHFNPYFADATTYSFAYSFDWNKLQNMSIGIQYLNFGTFQMTDETGLDIGTFSASDYVISLGKAHRVGPMTLGVQLKFASSAIDNYSSSALVSDIGGVFHVNRNWTMAMVIENLGFTMANSQVGDVPIPFDVKVGTSFKPEHMPVRFTLTSRNLTDRNLSLNETSNGRSNKALENTLKRINFGAELIFSQNFQLLFGYSHKRKQELRLNNIGGGAGFSYGLMIKVKRMQLRFSRATYHAAGGTSFISLQTNLKDFKKIL